MNNKMDPPNSYITVKLGVSLNDSGPKRCKKCGAYVSVNEGTCDDIGDVVFDKPAKSDPFIDETLIATNGKGKTIKKKTFKIDNGFMVRENEGKLAVVYDEEGVAILCAELVLTEEKCK